MILIHPVCWSAGVVYEGLREMTPERHNKDSMCSQLLWSGPGAGLWPLEIGMCHTHTLLCHREYQPSLIIPVYTQLEIAGSLPDIVPLNDTFGCCKPRSCPSLCFLLRGVRFAHYILLCRWREANNSRDILWVLFIQSNSFLVPEFISH